MFQYKVAVPHEELTCNTNTVRTSLHFYQSDRVGVRQMVPHDEQKSVTIYKDLNK